MPYYLLLLIIIYVGAIPGIVIGGLQEKKGVPQKAIATFSAPDGTKRQVQIDVTWSWTIFVFRGWALAFRGQFLPFLFVMLMSAFTFHAGIFKLWFAQGLPGDLGATLNASVADHFSNAESGAIFLEYAFITGYLFLVNYYVAFANKDRILQQIQRGFDFSHTPNVAELYKYVGYIPRTAPTPGTNVQAGKTHDYVVPDAVVENEIAKQAENDYDYSNLTVNDLKLLLKSEGVPYTTSNDKDELLELVDKFIVEPAKAEERKEKAQIKKANADAAAAKSEADKALAEAKAAKEEALKIMAEAEKIKAEATKETEISKSITKSKNKEDEKND